MRPQRPIRRVLVGVAAASIVAVAWSGWIRTGPDSVAQTIATLVNASSSARVTRGRLSEASRWAPAPSGTRGAADNALSLDGLQAALALRRLVESERTAATLRGSGIALLGTGHLDEAVDALVEAVELAPADASAHNDLAAALLDRAASGSDAYEAVRALDHAERSLRLAPRRPAGLFNRALAQEAVGNTGRAATAWREYLAVDGATAWAIEARERLAALEPSAPAPPPSLASVAALSPDELRRLAERHPAWLERALRLEVLPAWSEARTRPSAAAAERVGRALVEADAASPATTLAAAVAGSDTWSAGSRRCLADAVKALARWRVAVDRGDRAAALSEAKVAAQAVRCAGIDPLHAALPSAWAAMSSGERDRAARLAIAGADRAHRERYWSLEADLCEVLSALAIQDTRLSDATDVRLRGRAAALRARDRQSVGRFDELLGEAADEQGDRSAAWAHFRDALAALDPSSSPSHRYGTRSTVMIAALNADLIGAAAGFADDLLDAATASGRTTYKVMALLQRGRTRAALGDPAGGAGDLAAAEQLLSSLPDGPAKAAWQAEHGWITGVVKASTDPAAALRGLTTAIDYFDGFGRRFRLAELLLHRGRVHRALGDSAAAMADWTRGAELLEDQRPSIREEQLRISRTADVWGLFSELIELQAADAAASLHAFERAKARELLDAITSDREQRALSVADLQGCLPQDARAVVYGVLPTRLLIWSVTASSVALHVENIGRRPLERLVAASVRELAANEPQTAGTELSRRLLSADVGSGTNGTLIIVPDGPLGRVPFGALPRAGKWLVETATPLVAPSLTTFCVSSRRAPADVPRSALLVGVNEPIPDPPLPALPEVQGEISALAGIYEQRSVLIGAAATAPAITAAWTRHGILHFAGHASVDERHPLRSRLFTSPGAVPASLRLQDIAAARFMPGATVILAACETATGKVFSGEGTMNLARPFLAAGALAVLGSVWNIRDAEARRVVERVHRRLVGGERLERALAGAQRELIASGAAPSMWSGYVVTGGIPAR
jgi:CHAT domain-containing protein